MARLTWEEVPVRVRTELERIIGAPVIHTEDQHGGFSPCLATRAALADGRGVFIKAVSPAQNPDSPRYVRRELEVMRALPDDAPVPRVLATMDDGEWIAGVFELIDGRQPQIPWERAELDRVFEALHSLVNVAAPAGLPTAVERLDELFDGWRVLHRGSTDGLDRWAVDHLDDLVRLECSWARGAAGITLVHADVRSDNILITRSGDVVFVDWAHACAGAPWIDLVLWLPALALEGGGDPETLLHATAVGHAADPNAVTALVAAFTGYLVQRGRLPDPPGLPTLRRFQSDQGRIAMAWLKQRVAG